MQQSRMTVFRSEILPADSSTNEQNGLKTSAEKNAVFSRY